MYEVYVAARFEAAHRLVGDFGPATRTHGHTYRLEVILRGQHLGDDGTLYDIGELGQALESLVGSMHYRDLNEVPGLQEVNTTAEAVAFTAGRSWQNPPRPGPRLAYGAHLGVPRRLRSTRRRAGLRDFSCASPSSRWGPGRKTGGYLYNGRVIFGLRNRGFEIEEVVAGGASPDEQRTAAPGFGSTFDPSRYDAIVVDALARIAVAPHLDLWLSWRPVVALVHELPSVAAAGPDLRPYPASATTRSRCHTRTGSSP